MALTRSGSVPFPELAPESMHEGLPSKHSLPKSSRFWTGFRHTPELAPWRRSRKLVRVWEPPLMPLQGSNSFA